MSGRRTGWHPDPSNPTMFRWWDGVEWVAHSENAPMPPPPIISERESLATLRAQIIETRDMILLQDVGFYEYSHPLDTSAEYQNALAVLQDRMKEAVKAGRAVTGTKSWAINGSEKDGMRMVSDFSKLVLRAYNTEADNVVRTLKSYSKKASIERLDKMRRSIAKLVASMKISITDEYHAIRVKELELTADYLVKLDEERERLREERLRLKEEEAAQREFEREQERLEKEKAQRMTLLEAQTARGDAGAAAQTQEKIAEIDLAIQGVIDRKANIRAGWVYVISNIGSLGPHMVKIGMSRREQPRDRIRELGDASVPFRFDTHALFYSRDAAGVESQLHRIFAHRRVNLVNPHREFFYLSPLDVKVAIEKLQVQLLEFTHDPVALEWHQSQGARARLESGNTPQAVSNAPKLV